MKVVDDRGRKLDAEVSLQAAGDAFEIVIESRGGGRNNGYIPAFNLLFERLAASKAEVIGVELASRQVQKPLRVPKQRFPILLQSSAEALVLAGALRNAAAAAGRKAGARGMGNATKRLRIQFRVPDARANADRLAERIVGRGASRHAAARSRTRDARTRRMTPGERREALDADKRLDERPDLIETEKHVVIKQRLAQRLFRERLKTADCRCRVTGISDSEHLRASHVKPWARCDNREKQDPNNGLLLAPHVDHLFDEGYISFEDDGTLLVSKRLEPSLLKAWGLEAVRKVAAFSPKQAKYLAYHRRVVFKKPRM